MSKFPNPYRPTGVQWKTMSGERQARGRMGEAATVAFLERRGYRIVDTNIHFPKDDGPGGELDIIAWDGATLCFIEVKTRQGRGRVTIAPAEAVTPAKQRQISRLALAYAARHGLLDGDEGIAFRFDVAAVTLHPSPVGDDELACDIQLLKGAFLAPSEEDVCR